MTTPGVFASFDKLADLHERMAECSPTYTLDRQIAAWKAETAPERIAALNADWDETERLFEAARVEHGRGTPAYRAAHRAIVNRGA